MILIFKSPKYGDFDLKALWFCDFAHLCTVFSYNII